METGSTIHKGNLPERLLLQNEPNQDSILSNKYHGVQKEVIQQTMEKHGYTYAGKKLAAEELGISITTLYRRLDKLV